jgi:hypothetical protein
MSAMDQPHLYLLSQRKMKWAAIDNDDCVTSFCCHFDFFVIIDLLVQYHPSTFCLRSLLHNEYYISKQKSLQRTLFFPYPYPNVQQRLHFPFFSNLMMILQLN